MVKWWREHPGWSTLMITVFACALLFALGGSNLEIAGIFVCGFVWSAINGFK